MMPEKHRALLTAHCERCHDAKTQKGKFRVDDLPFAVDTVEAAERWQKVLNVLNAGEMPPEGEKLLAAREKADFLDDLANVMVAARKGLSDQHGAITMRRLNRREYRNTLRELLGVEINVAELPADTGTGGFDTVGSNLFMSSDQFEQYFALGREALDEAFERHAAAGVRKRLRFEGEESLPRITKFVSDEFDGHARGTKWVEAVMAAAARPENAAVVAELRKTAKDDAALRRAWAKIPGAPSPESFGFATGENNADKANRAAGLTGSHAFYRYYLGLPHLDTGAYLTIGQQDYVNSWITMLTPFGWPVGDYTVRIRVAAVEDAPTARRFLEFGINPRHGQVLSTHAITGTLGAPQVIEIPWSLTRQHSDRSDRTLFIREKGTADHIDQVRQRVNVSWFSLKWKMLWRSGGGEAVLVQPEMEDALARRRPSIAPSHLGKQLAVLSMVTLLPMSCIGTALYLNLDHTIPDADQRIRGGRDGGALDRKDLRWPGDGSAEMPEPICGMIADEFLHRGIEGHRHAKKCNR